MATCEYAYYYNEYDCNCYESKYELPLASNVLILKDE